MDIFFCEDACEVLEFFFIDIEESHEHLSGFIHIKSFSEIWILGRNPDGTSSLMTDAVLLASDTDHRNCRESDRICPHGECFCDIGTGTKSPCDEEGNISPNSFFIEEFASAVDGIWSRDTDIVFHMGRSSTSRSPTTVDSDIIRFCKDGNFEIIFDV